MTTTERWIFRWKLASALGCGLMAGVFFAFSTFVMSGLSQLPAAQGIAAMQSINITVINPVFLGAFMGTAASCLGLVVLAAVRRNQPGAAFLLAGSLLYLVGTFGVTAAFNVPMNDALAVVKHSDPAAARFWAGYVTNWTLWNHVRGLAALAATAALILSLCQRAPQ